MILVKIDGVVGEATLEGYDKSWFVATGFQFKVGEGNSGGGDDETDDPDEEDGTVVRQQKPKSKKRSKKSKGLKKPPHSDWEHMELDIDKEVDSASVYLMHLAMKSQAQDGMKYTAVEIHMLEDRAIEKAEKGVVLPFLKIRLENALISGWELTGEEEGKATESVTVWYDKAAMKYYAVSPNAPTQEHGPLGWDQYEGNWKCEALMKPPASGSKGK